MSSTGNAQDAVPNNYGTEIGTQNTPGNDLAQQQGWNEGQDQQLGSQDNNNALNSKRPLNVQPAREGGVAIDGREGLPEGKASFTDKLVGKFEKVTGKYTNNPEKHERGELRESGGKNTVEGLARAPHD